MLVLGLNVVHGFGFRREIESLGVSSGFECGACIWIQMGDRAFDTINVVHASGFRWEIVI